MPETKSEVSEYPNPYAPPSTVSGAASVLSLNRLPRFVKVVLILDLAACVYRVLNAAACALALILAPEVFEGEGVERVVPLLIPEIAIGIFIGFVGGIADVCGLRHKPSAYKFGLLAASGSGAFLVVLLWKLSLWTPQIESKLLAVSMLGLLATVRVAIILLYVFGLQSFHRWNQRRSAKPSTLVAGGCTGC